MLLLFISSPVPLFPSFSSCMIRRCSDYVSVSIIVIIVLFLDGVLREGAARDGEVACGTEGREGKRK